MLTTSSPVRVGSGIALGQPVNWSHPLNRGRVAWWLALPGRMSGPTWSNLMGSGHGTLTGGPKWGGTTRPGGYGQVLFDGVDDYADLGVLPLNGDFTVAAWVYAASLNSAGARRVLFGKKGGSNSRQMSLTWATTSKLSIGEEDIAIIATTAADFPLARWAHVAWTHKAGSHNVYIDAAVAATAAYTFVGPYAGPSYLGDASAFTFDGPMDDVTAYARGLSAAEVWSLRDLSRRGYPGVLNRLGPSLVAFPAAGGTDATAGPATATTAWTAVTPSVAAGATIAPATVTAAWTSNVPAVTTGATISPGTVTAAWTVNTPAVTTGTGASAATTTAAAAWAAGVPAVAGDAAAFPASATVAWTALAGAVTAGATTSPSTALAAWAAQDPAVAAGATVATASAGAEWAANSPSFGGVVATSTDPGFSLTGTGWTNAGTAGRGYAGGTFYYSGTADDTATFAVALPSAGTYKVAITYESASFRNQDTGVVVRDGATTLLSTTIDQTVAPDDFVYNGSGFEVLSPSLTFSGVTATVVLTVPTNTFYSIADAVYFESVAAGGFRPAWASHPATIGGGVY
jgi:hypothetical protein